MPRILYSLVLFLLLPVFVLRLFWRSRQNRAYRYRLGERFGLIKPLKLSPSTPPVWVHAVSVGETIAVTPLLKQLLDNDAELTMLITCTTPTGSDRIQSLFESYGDRVAHRYMPWDLPGCLDWFLFCVKPRLALMVETEVWPNILAKLQVPKVLINARMSAKSAAGYQRLAALTRPAFDRFDCVLAQSEHDAQRLLSLGVKPEAMSVSGSIKFDIDISAAMRTEAQELRKSLGLNNRPVMIAASTHQGEDEIILAAFKQLRMTLPESVLILVPRHPERFDRVYQLADQDFACVRRSAGLPLAARDAVLLGDTMGELLLLMGLADIAFIGGSLVPNGGHNMLEAAVWSLPVLSGPSVFNFQLISDELIAQGAMELCGDAEAMSHHAVALLTNEALRVQRGQAGAAFVEQNKGALQRHYQQITDLLI